MRCGTKNTKTSLGATEKSRENSRCAMDERKLSHEAAGGGPLVPMFPPEDDADRIVNYFMNRQFKGCASVHINEHERNVVRCWAFAPCSDAVENPLLHVLEREQRGFADKFLHAFDAQHFAARVENVGDAGGIEHDAVAGQQVDVQR